MRRFYESYNYLDGQPNACNHRFSRTKDQQVGFFASADGNRMIPYELSMSRVETENLRNMLNEVLEDWQ